MTVNKVPFLIVVFITHTIQAAMGFGGSMTAMPFSIRLIGGGALHCTTLPLEREYL